MQFKTTDEALAHVIASGFTYQTGYGKWANADATVLIDSDPLDFHSAVTVREIEDQDDRRWFAKHGHKPSIKRVMAYNAKKYAK